ncbi:MAG: AraC family transcriptional regulator, partial [Bacillota bacterium]|nr:AraC family transcriptional regulator [Bacillota bacterium]
YSGSLSKLKGWKDMQHSHEFLEIVFVVEGEGTLMIEDAQQKIQFGDIIIYNAGIMHAEQSSEDSPMEMFFVAFDKIELPNLPKNHLLPPDFDSIYQTGDMYNDFKVCFELVTKETANKEVYYIEISQNASRALLMYLLRLINKANNTPELVRHGEVLDKALKFMDENFINNISLEDISAHCFVNKYYLSHLFTQYKGITIGQYIYDKKIEEAKRLLRDTELSVAQISEKSGFNDISYFSRAFKKSVNMTPVQYRKSAAL